MAALTGLVTTSTPVPNVRVIALNRPEKRNALSQNLIDEFLQEVLAASRDASVNVIIVSGNQSFFSGQLIALHCNNSPFSAMN